MSTPDHIQQESHRIPPFILFRYINEIPGICLLAFEFILQIPKITSDVGWIWRWAWLLALSSLLVCTYNVVLDLEVLIEPGRCPFSQPRV